MTGSKDDVGGEEGALEKLPIKTRKSFASHLSCKNESQNKTERLPLEFRLGQIGRAGIAGLILLGSTVVLSAQSEHSSPATTPALTEQQRAGRILFMQNCAFCHLPYRTEDKTGKETASIGPNLKGLLQKDKPLPDAAIRTFITKGVPQKMPAFQYGLDQREVHLIIEYLKVY
jgi:mono/diheme cytochrome c family protein